MTVLAIHAVDKVHAGTTDSSVLYIPVCPVTELNAQYLVRQRAAFRDGTPGPDFPGGKGESEHIDRPSDELIHSRAARQAFGLERIDVDNPQTTRGERAAAEQFNSILGL